MIDTASFGALLRQYRLAASLSQEALAERARLSVTAIAALERGRRTAPRPGSVLLLAEALDLSAEQKAALVEAARPSARSVAARATRSSATSAACAPQSAGRPEHLHRTQWSGAPGRATARYGAPCHADRRGRHRQVTSGAARGDRCTRALRGRRVVDRPAAAARFVGAGVGRGTQPGRPGSGPPAARQLARRPAQPAHAARARQRRALARRVRRPGAPTARERARAAHPGHRARAAGHRWRDHLARAAAGDANHRRAGRGRGAGAVRFGVAVRRPRPGGRRRVSVNDGQIWPRSPRSALDSKVFRWRSSSRPRGWARSRSRRSSIDWTTVFAS